MRQTAATESSVVLAWTPSTDNVGVVEYGLYASGVRVTTVSDASATLTGLSCGKSYLIALDAADAAGNRSTQTSALLQDLRLPLDQQATHHTHRGQGHRGHRHHRRSLVDRLHRRRRRDGLRALPVRLANQRDNRHDRAVHRAQVRHDVHARSRRQRRRRPALGACDPLHRNLTLHTHHRRRARRARSPRRSRTVRR